MTETAQGAVSHDAGKFYSDIVEMKKAHIKASQQAHAIGTAVNRAPSPTCISVPRNPSLSLGLSRDASAADGLATTSDKRRVIMTAAIIGPESR